MNIPTALLFSMFCYLLFNINSYASPTEQLHTKERLFSTAVQVSDSYAIDTYQKASRLKELSEVALTNNWLVTQVKIQVELLNIYTELYQTKEAITLIKQIYPLVQQLNLTDEQLYIEANILANNLRLVENITIEGIEEKILANLPNIKNKRLKISIKLAMSFYYIYKPDLVTALKFNQEIIEELNQLPVDAAELSHKNIDHIAASYSSLSNIYDRIGQQDKAIEYAQRTITQIQQIDSKYSEAIYRHNLIFTLIDYERLDEAKQEFSSWEPLLKQLNQTVLWADFYRLKGMIAALEFNYSEAATLQKQSIAIYDHEGLEDYRMLSEIQLLKNLIAQQHYASAKQLISSIEHDVNILASTKEKVAFYSLVIEVANHSKDYKRALNASMQVNAFNKELLQSKNAIEIQKLEYEQMVKDASIVKRQLEDKNTLQTALIIQKNQHTTILVLFSVLISSVLLVIIVLFYRQYKAKQHATLLAHTDSLTSVANRRAILAIGEKEFARCKAHKLPFCVAVADIDLFKSFNDKFGHAKGDEVLKYFAHHANNAMRETEYFGRIGGEEWLFILPNVDKPFASTLFERMNKALNRLHTEIEVDQLVTFSMGVAQFKHHDNLALLIKEADQKLYEAKSNGRNQVH